MGGSSRTCVSWLSHTSTNTNFFPKPPTTFLTIFSRVEKRKYAGKKSRLYRVSNSQPPGHESDTLTTEPRGRGRRPLRMYIQRKMGLTAPPYSVVAKDPKHNHGSTAFLTTDFTLSQTRPGFYMSVVQIF